VQCPGSQIVATEGANQVVAATAADANGNHASVSGRRNVSVMPDGLSIFSVTETDAWLPFASAAVAATT